MTGYDVRGAPSRGLVDRTVARAQRDLAGATLTKLRAKAVAWRNGLGGLLVGLAGFGLVKGRTDIGELAPGYATFAGASLLVAVLAGGIGAMWILRAAHGSLSTSAMKDVAAGRSRDPIRDVDIKEAQESARALTLGGWAIGICAGFLVLAVGVTWYGPTKDQPQIAVTTPAGDGCGKVVRLRDGELTLKTSAGEQEIVLANATGLRVVEKCGS